LNLSLPFEVLLCSFAAVALLRMVITSSEAAFGASHWIALSNVVAVLW